MQDNIWNLVRQADYANPIVHAKFLYWLQITPEVNPGVTHPLVRDEIAGVARVMCKIANGYPIDDALEVAGARATRALQCAAAEAWAQARELWAAVSETTDAEDMYDAKRDAESISQAMWAANSALELHLVRAVKCAAQRTTTAAEEAAYTIMAEKLTNLLAEYA